MRFKNLLATGLITATLFGVSINTHAQTTSFRDVPKGHWSEEAISYLATKGVISGYGNGNFGFSDNITRGQVTAIISRYLSLKDNGTSIKQFTDIKGHMFEGNIKTVVQAGIMSGDNTDAFRPDDTLTRYEMAVILQKTFRLGVSAYELFHDVPNNHWAKDYVRALYSNGITNGIGDFQYGGDMEVTREQFAKFMYNAVLVDPNFVPQPTPNKGGNVDPSTELRELAKSLGFFERGSEYVYLAYNPYGEKGDHSFDLMHFYPQKSGQWDATMYIYSNSQLINKPAKTLLNKLLPTKGEYLYSLIQNPNFPYGEQRFELDGRMVKVVNKKTKYIYFGPKAN